MHSDDEFAGEHLWGYFSLVSRRQLTQHRAKRKNAAFKLNI